MCFVVESPQWSTASSLFDGVLSYRYQTFIRDVLCPVCFMTVFNNIHVEQTNNRSSIKKRKNKNTEIRRNIVKIERKTRKEKKKLHFHNFSFLQCSTFHWFLARAFGKGKCKIVFNFHCISIYFATQQKL